VSASLAHPFEEAEEINEATQRKGKQKASKSAPPLPSKGKKKAPVIDPREFKFPSVFSGLLTSHFSSTHCG
jgi:hypothetical protein